VIYHHCRDYRKSSGAPVSLFAEYRIEQVEMAQGMPKVYESSLDWTSAGPSAAMAGSRSHTMAERLPSEVYGMVGVLDNPEPFEPETHTRVSQKPAWLNIRDELPRYRESSIPQ
jgi:hypothetical protein